MANRYGSCDWSTVCAPLRTTRRLGCNRAFIFLFHVRLSRAVYDGRALHENFSASRRADALLSARCIRETVATGSGGAGVGVTTADVAYVTERGTLVLRVLEKYIDEKHDAFIGCGREEVPGSRSEVDARKTLAELQGFVVALRVSLRATLAVEEGVRPRFHPARPTLAPGDERFPRNIMEPLPRATSKLSPFAVRREGKCGMKCSSL